MTKLEIKNKFTKDFLYQEYITNKKTMKEIADTHGCCLMTIRRKLNKFKLYTKPHTISSRDLIGQKINMLEALEWIPRKKNPVILCRCDCGNIKRINSSALKSGDAKSCGCLNKICRFKGYGEISQTFWGTLIRNANERGIEFNITIEDTWQLFLKQDRKCALSGERLIFYTKGNGKLYKEIQTASLDRIDSTKGYVEGNVQWVHKWINIIKWDFTQEEFIQWCKKVAENN